VNVTKAKEATVTSTIASGLIAVADRLFQCRDRRCAGVITRAQRETVMLEAYDFAAFRQTKVRVRLSAQEARALAEHLALSAAAVSA